MSGHKKTRLGGGSFKRKYADWDSNPGFFSCSFIKFREVFKALFYKEKNYRKLNEC
jgi:hypothetical protein